MEYGKSLDEINKSDLGVPWGILYILSLPLFPVLTLLGIDLKPKRVRQAERMRKEYFSIRDGIYIHLRQRFFADHDVPYPFDDNNPIGWY